MNQEQFLSLLRDILKVIGASFVAKGAVVETDWTTWTGLAMMIAPIGWSYYEKTKARMIAKVDAMPEVKGIVLKQTEEGKALAEAVPSPTVVPAGTPAASAVAR